MQRKYNFALTIKKGNKYVAMHILAALLLTHTHLVILLSSYLLLPLLPSCLIQLQKLW